MEQDWGWKIGIPLAIIGFIVVSQTTLAGLIPVLSIHKYIPSFTMPTVLFGVNIVIIAWILLALGILCTVLAIFDLPPFNY